MTDIPKYSQDITNEASDTTIPVEYQTPIVQETQNAIYEARKDFFIENLNTWVQFSIYASWIAEPNLYLFKEFIWIDLISILEQEDIGLYPNSSFVVMIYDGELIIFDGISNTSILSINLDSRETVKSESIIFNNPDNDNYIINFEDDFLDSLPEDRD